jgi:uncharacterized membrane protein YqjE
MLVAAAVETTVHLSQLHVPLVVLEVAVKAVRLAITMAKRVQSTLAVVAVVAQYQALVGMAVLVLLLFDTRYRSNRWHILQKYKMAS